MDYLKKLQRRKKIEIFFWLIIICSSYFIWDFENFETTTAYFETHSLVQIINTPSNVKCILANNDDALQLAPIYNVDLVNTTYRQEKFNIYLGISKKFDQDNLYIYWKNIYKLKDLYAYENEEYIYYLVDKDTLVADEKTYFYQLWDTAVKTHYVNVDVLLEKI